jgi:hypothetical protein
MKFIKLFMCALFFIAAGISPAAALPHCSKMVGMTLLSNASGSPHCKGMVEPGTDTKTQTNPSDPKPTSTPDSPHHKKGCCCDGDMGGTCKTNCKTVIGAAVLVDLAKQLHFHNTFNTRLSVLHAAFIFEVTTPPPKSCV